MYHKILITASSFSHICCFHLPYLKAFREAGATVHVACGGTDCNLPDNCYDKIIPVPLEKRMLSLHNIRAMKLLHSLIVSENYDLVITHTSLAAFFTRVSIPRKNKRPRVIYMCHGYLFDDNSSHLRRAVFLLAERIVSNKTDLLLCMNQYDHNIAEKYRLGHKTILVPGVGVNYARLDQSLNSNSEEMRRLHGISQDAFVLFYAAEFSHRKNQEFLIRAMTHLPEYVFLVLAGNGDLLASCKALSEKLNLQDRILFPGHVNPVSDWYVMSDVAVSSSRSEGLPFNILEAMHFSLPIIASDVKGNSDLIQHNETGLLFPYGNMHQYVAAVHLLLASQKKCLTLGAAAFAASGAYSLDNVFPDIWGHYLSFI